MEKTKQQKAKERQKKLAKRKHYTGSIVNPEHHLPYNFHTGKNVFRYSVSGNTMTDLLEESNITKITQENLEKIKKQWVNTVAFFHKGGVDRHRHGLFTENTYIAKPVLNLVKTQIEASSDEEQEILNLECAIFSDLIEEMVIICKQFYKQVVEHSACIIDDKQKETCDQFIEYYIKFLSYLDVGLFQRACRNALRDLQDKRNHDPEMKYFRVREGRELIKDILAYRKEHPEVEAEAREILKKNGLSD